MMVGIIGRWKFIASNIVYFKQKILVHKFLVHKFLVPRAGSTMYLIG
jgi:hypothetical protein